MVKAKKRTKEKALTKQTITKIKELTEELIKLLGVEKTEIKVVAEEDNARIQIDCPDPGILIGGRGETISSLQLILSLTVYKKLGYWQKLVVNINDYLEKRGESLKQMALNASQRVKFSGEPAVMPYLNSAERRLIHLALVDDVDVVTESVGEGRERRLVIKPKEQEKT